MKLIASNQLTVTNLLERAETRRETFYKLTNSADVPTAPSEGGRNLLKNSKVFTGSNITGSSTVLSETYQGCTVRYFKNDNPNSNLQDFAQFLSCVTPNSEGEYVASFWAKGSGTTRVFFYNGLSVSSFVTSQGVSDNRGDGRATFTLSENWERYWVKYKLRATTEQQTVSKHLLFRHDNNSTEEEVWLAGCKLEEGNVTTPYSQAPEDLGWSSTTLVPTQQQRYLWKFEYIYYSDGSVEVTQPVNLSIAGADADTTGITDAINQANQTVAGLQNSVSQAQSDLATVSSNLTQARQNLESSIASVNTKAQAVETTLAQVQSTANANSQKTATLENDLDGLSARFSSLKVGAVNLLKNSKSFKGSNIGGSATLTGETYQDCAVRYFKNTNPNSARQEVAQFNNCVYPQLGGEYVASFWAKGSGEVSIFFHGDQSYLLDDLTVSSWGESTTRFDGYIVLSLAENWQRYWIKYKLKSAPSSATSVGKHLLFRHNNNSTEDEIYLAGVQLEEGNIATDYSPNEADLELKVAEYKQTADQNYASLQTTVQNLDGTVKANKTTADQTAEGFKTRIESLETYKSGESTRASQYFESAKTETARQLSAERTAIANNYVAKSTYTSDVTGLRNDLTATTTTANTTKTNLASYQASNDQAVASLQSSLQTTDGNVSNLQTQVAAVPGQITSAVSAVEGKIPKSVNTVNLIKNTDKPFAMGYGITNTTWDDNKKWAYLDLTDPNVDTAKESEILPQGNFWNFKPIKGMTYTQSILIDTDATFNPNGQLQNSWFTSSQGHNQKQGYFEQLSDTTYRFWSTCTWQLEGIALRAFDWFGLHNVLDFRNSGTYLAFYKPKLTTGNLPSDWSPAPEDTASDISNLSSQIQQTADGMTLLATKTELNSAKTELQSGISTATSKADSAQATANNNAQTISTHTTQISALNTGLQAKVSQSDFNTLSGRVTTAESNLTATASQLSSQISSVENKIPTSVGGRNYIKNSDYRKAAIWVNDNQSQDEAFDISSAFWQNSNVYAKKIKLSFCYQPSVAYETERKFPVYFRTSPWPLIGEVTYPANTTRLIKYTLAMTSALPANFTANQIFIRFSGNLDKGRYHNIGKVMLEVSDVFSDWSPAPEDYDSALSTAKSEIKQTTDAITASVSSVETKADNAQTTANSAVSKANAAQTAVNTLDSEVVKSASLNLDNNGFVTKVGKTINGNKFATMIAQDANNVKIIADEMQVTADMIVDGAVTAEKLDVNNLSAVNSDLGEIKGGSLLLQENKSAGSATDNWGTYNRPAYKQGLYMDNHAFASSGAIQRKNGGETTPTDMPLAVLQAGELRFLVVDYNDNLKNVVRYGLSDPDYGVIKFEIDSELKRRLTMTSSGYLNFQASNYTDWIPLSQQGCEYMIQGRLVVVNYDVTYSQGGTHKIGDIPQEFVKKELMLTAKAWSITPNDKNFQLNADGGLHLLNADANITYRGTLLFSY